LKDLVLNTSYNRLPDTAVHWRVQGGGGGGGGDGWGGWGRGVRNVAPNL